jgi:hypothetical protein
MRYVIKNERLKDYLYCLGFNYIQVEDKNKIQEYIYLFNKTDKLLDAITYYTNFKQEQKQVMQVKNQT